jgi:hypothetical protein
MKRLFVLVVMFLLVAGKTMAVENPTASPNNRVGIHITDRSDLDKAQALLNSTGGDWGYVTVVIREDQRNTDYWQEVFDSMREKHLIPIVRLATKQDGGVWTVPEEIEMKKWAEFLNSLNWVVKNRYVILFNEPNHAKEWGGTLRPEEYAKVAMTMAGELKQQSSDFFVLPAGMDASAPNGADTMAATTYWERMYAAEPEVFKRFDGWTSHSYPNPGFMGNPGDTGMRSIRGYIHELAVVSAYGVPANIPVFITETGWQHQQGKRQSGISADLAAKYYTLAYENAWNNPQVVAVTPFILNYPSEPFDMFSWVDYKTGEPLPQYEAVKSLAKVGGVPVQIDDAQHTSVFLPSKLVAGSKYSMALKFKNTGQSIWNSEEVQLALTGLASESGVIVDSISETKPNKEVKIWVRFTVPQTAEQGEIAFQLNRHGVPMGQPVIHTFAIVPKSNLLVRLGLWFRHLLYPRDFLVGLSEIVLGS